MPKEKKKKEEPVVIVDKDKLRVMPTSPTVQSSHYEPPVISEQEKRKKIINNHKAIIEIRIGLVQSSKIDTKEIKDYNSNLERIEIASKNELHLVENYYDNLLHLNNDFWNIYHEIVTTEERSQGTYEALPIDVEVYKGQVLLLNRTAISGCSSTCSGYVGVYNALQGNYSSNESFQQELQKNEPQDTFWEDVDFIKKRMNQIIDTSGENFYQSINSFISEDKGQKFKRLMDVRHSIVDNFLDKLYPNTSFFCNSQWFQQANPGSQERKLCYSQSKYFIIGNNEDSDVPTAFKEQINKASYDMQESYEELSNNGHDGTSDDYALYLVKKAVPSLKSLLELKD